MLPNVIVTFPATPLERQTDEKSGGGKAIGCRREEVDDFRIPVKQVFKDEEYREDELMQSEDFNKIRVVIRRILNLPLKNKKNEIKTVCD